MPEVLLLDVGDVERAAVERAVEGPEAPRLRLVTRGVQPDPADAGGRVVLSGSVDELTRGHTVSLEQVFLDSMTAVAR